MPKSAGLFERIAILRRSARHIYPNQMVVKCAIMDLNAGQHTFGINVTEGTCSIRKTKTRCSVTA